MKYIARLLILKLFTLTYGVKRKDQLKALKKGRKIPPVSVFFANPLSYRDFRYRRFMMYFRRFKFKIDHVCSHRLKPFGPMRLRKKRRVRTFRHTL